MREKRPNTLSPNQELTLMRTLWSDDIKYYPERAVMYAFPWGVEGTPLEHFKGPRKWQMEELENYGRHIREQREALQLGRPLKLYQSAVCSGRGIGKSAGFGFLAWYHMSCIIGSTTIVAANGEPQLISKTFPEIKKWITMSINAHWFEVTALSIKPAQWLAEKVEEQFKMDTSYYYVKGQLWSEENPEAFAGAHNFNGMFVMFDEASGIPAPIWTVTQGFYTEAIVHRAFMVFSNGRRNQGAFYNCFNDNRDFWRTQNIDSRDVEDVDHTTLNQIVSQYGEDSDEARVEVKGQFPHQGDHQLIPGHVVSEAMSRSPVIDDGAPLVIGVDPSRMGMNKTVIAFRKGNDAVSIPWRMYGKLDLVMVAHRVAEAINEYKPQAVFIEANGIGDGVIDQLKHMGYRVTAVNTANTARAFNRYANVRTELWCLMKDWLDRGSVPKTRELFNDLTGVECYDREKDNKRQLESKVKSQSRGIPSPDYADALAVTFAGPVPRTDAYLSRSKKKASNVWVDYPMFGESDAR